jgi:hypothetical protein
MKPSILAARAAFPEAVTNCAACKLTAALAGQSPPKLPHAAAKAQS